MAMTSETIYPHELAELRGELDAYRNGMLQLAIDKPGPVSPRIPGIEAGIPVVYLQQTHQGVPVWICAGCIKTSVGVSKPPACVGCGDYDVTEALCPNVLIDTDDETQTILFA